MAYWKEGNKIVADSTRQFDGEWVPYPCWVAGIRTGHVGTVIGTKTNRLGRVRYTVDFGYTHRVMDLEEVKNPDEPYRYPPGVGKFLGELYNRRNRGGRVARREMSAHHEEEEPKDTIGQGMNRYVNAEYQVESPTAPRHDTHGNLLGQPIRLGDTVRVLDVDTGEYCSYIIVNPGEIDPRNGKISYNSPIGNALIGKRAGDEISVRIPRGEKHYIIDSLELENPSS